jgi:hypothetical protein
VAVRVAVGADVDRTVVADAPAAVPGRRLASASAATAARVALGASASVSAPPPPAAGTLGDGRRARRGADLAGRRRRRSVAPVALLLLDLALASARAATSARLFNEVVALGLVCSSPGGGRVGCPRAPGPFAPTPGRPSAGAFVAPSASSTALWPLLRSSG